MFKKLWTVILIIRANSGRSLCFLNFLGLCTLLMDSMDARFPILNSTSNFEVQNTRPVHFFVGFRQIPRWRNLETL